MVGGGLSCDVRAVGFRVRGGFVIGDVIVSFILLRVALSVVCIVARVS